MDAFQGLLTQSSASSPSPELLEMLGRKAAQMFTENQVPLNDGIRQLISEHPELGNEHIRRVIEFANNSAFQTLFEQSADKNVHFTVADPGAVIRDAKDGGSSAFAGQTLDGGKADYLSSPSRAQGDQGDAELSQLFAGSQEGASPLMKVASAGEMEVPHADHANPVEDVYDAHVHTQAARDQLAVQNDEAQVDLDLAKEDLYKSVKDEVLRPDGAGLRGVMMAIQKVANISVDPPFVDIVQRMMRDGVTPDYLEQSFAKTASSVVVNPSHPIIMSWRAMEKAAEARQVLDAAILEADRALGHTRGFFYARAR